MKQITILLADDNNAVRTGFRELLELQPGFEVIGEAKNGRQAVTMAKKLRPAIVFMDLAMPLLNGIGATREILQALPNTLVLMLSAYSDEAYVEAATQAGARGYILKQSATDDLCRAIRAVHKGNTFYSPSLPHPLNKSLWQKLPPPVTVA